MFVVGGLFVRRFCRFGSWFRVIVKIFKTEDKDGFFFSREGGCVERDEGDGRFFRVFCIFLVVFSRAVRDV